MTSLPLCPLEAASRREAFLSHCCVWTGCWSTFYAACMQATEDIISGPLFGCRTWLIGQVQLGPLTVLFSPCRIQQKPSGPHARTQIKDTHSTPSHIPWDRLDGVFQQGRVLITHTHAHAHTKHSLRLKMHFPGLVGDSRKNQGTVSPGHKS